MSIEFSLAPALLCAAVAINTLAAPGAGRQQLSVLFIGNSYSFDLPQVFEGLSSATGKRVRVAQATSGGFTLQQHLTAGDARQKLGQGGWDVVVLQEQSQMPSLPEAQVRREMDPAVTQWKRRVIDAKAKPMLFGTWGESGWGPPEFSAGQLRRHASTPARHLAAASSSFADDKPHAEVIGNFPEQANTNPSAPGIRVEGSFSEHHVIQTNRAGFSMLICQSNALLSIEYEDGRREQAGTDGIDSYV